MNSEIFKLYHIRIKIKVKNIENYSTHEETFVPILPWLFRQADKDINLAYDTPGLR